ncbi:MAG TPA: biotin-dependent carboxyltransferase [Firmicutes bacterium]|nr:biotin-dependent carboxyltransferase [Bacillota bacterium]
MTAVLEVVMPGLLTTVQDRGRHGYQAFGMPVAGAVDEYALRIANILVGNPEGAAALEMTLLGPQLKVLAPTKLALTGADLGAEINGQEFPRWQTVAVATGDEITFKAATSGCRGYLAVAGGIDVPEVMGSRSTYLRGKIGGLDGRALKVGDHINANSAAAKKNIQTGAQLAPELMPRYEGPITLRVILGPQDDHFTPTGQEIFLSSKYQVTTDADRMGCRLEGATIEHAAGADIISDGIPLGAVQVPGHGLPIIMLADRQTTGGYPKIATVASVDLSHIAQAKPGDEISFEAISRSEAIQLLKEREAALNEWAKSLPEASGRIWHFSIGINGQTFTAQVEEVQ